MREPTRNTHKHELEERKQCTISNIDASAVFDEEAKIAGIEVTTEHVEKPVVTGVLSLRDFNAESSDNKNVVKEYIKPVLVDTNLFDNIDIPDISTDEIKKLVSEVMIRFDTDPRNLLKDDFRTLINLIINTSIAGLSIDVIQKPFIESLFSDELERNKIEI